MNILKSLADSLAFRKTRSPCPRTGQAPTCFLENGQNLGASGVREKGTENILMS